MIPAKLDLPTIWRGCEWGVVTLIWRDKTGQPYDLTGWMARAHSREFDLNAIVSDGKNGGTQMSLTAQQTAELNLGVFEWDWIFFSNNNRNPLGPFLAGKVVVKQPVTSTNGQ